MTGITSRPGWYCKCSLNWFQTFHSKFCLTALRLNLEWFEATASGELDKGQAVRFFFAYTFWVAGGTSSRVHCMQSATDLLVSFGRTWQMGSLRKRGFCLKNWAHDPFKTPVFLSAVLWTLSSTSIFVCMYSPRLWEESEGVELNIYCLAK